MRFLKIFLLIIGFIGIVNAKVTNYGRIVFVDPTSFNHYSPRGNITIALIDKKGAVVAKKSVFLNKNSSFKVIFSKKIKPFIKIKFYFKPKGKKKSYVWVSSHTKTGARIVIKSSKKPHYKLFFRIIKLKTKAKAIGSLGGFAVSGRVTT